VQYNASHKMLHPFLVTTEHLAKKLHTEFRAIQVQLVTPKRHRIRITLGDHNITSEACSTTVINTLIK